MYYDRKADCIRKETSKRHHFLEFFQRNGQQKNVMNIRMLPNLEIIGKWNTTNNEEST